MCYMMFLSSSSVILVFVYPICISLLWNEKNVYIFIVMIFGLAGAVVGILEFCLILTAMIFMHGLLRNIEHYSCFDVQFL